MVDFVMDIANVTGSSLSDIPEMLSRVVTGQAALRNALSPKDRAKADRLNDVFAQLQTSLQRLVETGNTTVQVKGLNESVTQVHDLLEEYQEFWESVMERQTPSKNKIKSVMQRKEYSAYLDELTEKIQHTVKVFRFSVSLSGYVLYQKNNSLARLIADPVACDQWIQTFGTSTTSVSYAQTLTFLSNYFSEFGRDSQEFEANCNSDTFFSWFRHEGTWSKCSTCKEKLFEVMCDAGESKMTENAEVKLHSFAAFCGENLLLAIRDLIVSAHPWNSNSRFQLISPDLHVQEEIEEGSEISSSVHKSARLESALQHNQIVFVGQSDHLAELHHSTCKQVYGKSVMRIDCVKDLHQFKDWMDENKDNLFQQRGKILVVVDCQFVCCEREPSQELNSPRQHDLLADKVLKYLKMKKAYSVGVALLTCPFLVHDASQIENLRDKYESTPFERRLISSDFRKMSDFIESMFAVPLKTDEREPTAAIDTAEPSRVPTSQFAEELSEDKGKFADAAAKYKKAKKSKKNT